MPDSDISAVGSAYNTAMGSVPIGETEAERDARGRRVLWIFIAIAFAAAGLGVLGYFYTRSNLPAAGAGSVRG